MRKATIAERCPPEPCLPVGLKSALIEPIRLKLCLRSNVVPCMDPMYRRAGYPEQGERPVGTISLLTAA